MLENISRVARLFGSAAALSVCASASLPAHAESPGRGLTAEFEKEYLTFIINHHFSALRMTELAAGTDLTRNAEVDNPQEGTSPTANTASTAAKAGDADIKSMARMANRMQREEIAKAQKFLHDWYGIHHTPQLPEVAQQQIQVLEQTAAGKQFDQAFLEVFSAHHYGAIMPSQDCRVKADLKHDELKHYCEGIVEKQTMEINDMRMHLCEKFSVCDYQPTTGVRGQHTSSATSKRS
jgi:uncharacterized protein (DUF305 family)